MDSKEHGRVAAEGQGEGTAGVAVREMVGLRSLEILVKAAECKSVCIHGKITSVFEWYLLLDHQ
jgi:hypothetical protein